MAKTKTAVTLAYNKAVTQANNLEGIARKIEQQKNKISENRGSLSGAWRGNNANAYQGRMRERESELARVAGDLNKVAKTIKEVAKNTYNADMKAVELAQKRKYASGSGRKR